MAGIKQVKTEHGEIRGNQFYPAKKRDSLPANVCIMVTRLQLLPSSCVRSLGVLFACSLRMKQQIGNSVKLRYYQIRNILGESE